MRSIFSVPSCGKVVRGAVLVLLACAQTGSVAAGPRVRLPAGFSFDGAGRGSDFAPVPVAARAAAPAASSEAGLLTAEESEAVQRAWFGMLSSIEGLREHGEFLGSGRVRISIEENDFPGLQNALAVYSSGRLRIKRQLLDEGKKALLKQGVEPKDLCDALAARTLPLVVHELRHGITDRQVREAVGLPFQAALIESEVLAYADQLRAVHILRRLRPELFRYDLRWISGRESLLESAWKNGIDGAVRVDGLDKYVRSFCTAPSVLTDGRESVLAYYRSEVEDSRSLVADWGVLPADAPERDQLLFAWSQEHLKTVEEAEALYSDAGRHEKLRAFFAAAYEGLRKVRRL